MLQICERRRNRSEKYANGVETTNCRISPKTNNLATANTASSERRIVKRRLNTRTNPVSTPISQFTSFFSKEETEFEFLFLPRKNRNDLPSV